MLIDDEDVGRISYGETKSFEVASGSHRLEVRQDWTGSNPLIVQVAGGEEVKVVIRHADKPRLFSRDGYLQLELDR